MDAKKVKKIHQKSNFASFLKIKKSQLQMSPGTPVSNIWALSSIVIKRQVITYTQPASRHTSSKIHKKINFASLLKIQK